MNLVRYHVIYCLHVTKPNALGITITQVAFGYLSIFWIKMHGTKWANRYARSTTDTNLIIDRHACKGFITGNSLYWADVQARGVLTLLAGHGDVKAFRLPLDNPDTTSGWV
jgi:hypothetical protein